MRSPWARALLALVCCCCAACSATAQKQDGIAVQRGNVVRADATIIPADISLFISFDNAAKLRKLPAGRFVETSLTALVPEGNLRAAWRELARAMDMSPEQTFDQLLGKRVILTARQNPQGPPSWAILTEIDKQSYKQLTSKLKPAPRGMLNARPVLALERGEFLLTAVYGKRKGASLALLAPRDNADLFEEIAAALGGVHKDPLVKQPDFAQARKLDPNANILFFTRRVNPAANNQQGPNPQGPIAGVGGAGGWMAMSAVAGVRTISIKGLTFSPGAPKPTRTWSLEAFEQMSNGALVSIVDDAFLDAMPFDPVGLLNLKQFEHLDVDDLLTPSWAFRVTKQGDALSFAQAAFTPNTKLLAPRADRLIAEILADRLDDPALIEDNFAGFDPGVTRSVNLASLANKPTDSPLGPTPALAWRYDKSINPQDMPNAGWWLIASSTEGIDRFARALADVQSSNNDPWIALGHVRPALIIDALANKAAALQLAPFLDPLSRLDTLQWRAAPVNDLLFVEINIQLTEPPRFPIQRAK